MPKAHWHASVDQILLYGLSAIVVFNLVEWVGAKLAKTSNPWLKTTGEAMCALVN